MKNIRNDAYCGLYCGACEIIIAETGQDKERVAKMWGSTIDQVNCLGCKTDTLFLHCANCKIRKKCNEDLSGIKDYENLSDQDIAF